MSVSRTSRAIKREADRGSLWRKWDLHLHAPGTMLSNGYGKPDEATWLRFVDIRCQRSSAAKLSNGSTAIEGRSFSGCRFSGADVRYRSIHLSPTERRLSYRQGNTALLG